MNTTKAILQWICSFLLLALAMGDSSYAGQPGTWTPAGRLNIPRSRHTATLLADGRVLVTGGQTSGANGPVPIASCELFDPVAGTWSTTGALATARSRHVAVLLTDGMVLVAGGRNENGAIATAELFDPVLGTWTSAASMTVPRDFHTATLLADGRVLVAGGLATLDGRDNPAEKSAEIYDPSTNTWAFGDHMAQARWGHTATPLSDGTVLVAGGTGPALDGVYTVRAEFYDPAANRWHNVDSMAVPRGFHIAAQLADGNVLVAGGLTLPQNGTGVTGSAEIFDRSIGRWSATGSLSVPRGAGPHGATLLLDGRFFVAGGRTFTAEIYNPQSRKWTLTGPMSVSRSSHTITLLANGDVLAAGGENFNGFISIAETYTP